MLLTVDEVVTRLHAEGLSDLNKKWVQNAIDRGRLPAVVIARKRRVQSVQVDRMIDRWKKEAS